MADVLHEGIKLLLFLQTMQFEAEPVQAAQIAEHKLHDPLLEKYPLGQLVTHCDPICKNPVRQVTQLMPESASWQVAQGEGQILQLPLI